MVALSDGLISVSDMSELEKFSIPQLIRHLKTEFRAEVFNKVEQILTSRDETWKVKEEMWKKIEQTWKQKEEMWKHKFENQEARVVKLEEDTSALVVLAAQLPENNGVDFDVGAEENKASSEINEGSPIMNSRCKTLADHNEERERSSSPGLLCGNPTFENVIEISDSEGENENPRETFFNEVVTKTGSTQKAEKKTKHCGDEYSLVSTPKQKQALYIVGSDSEDEGKCMNGPDGSNIEAIDPVKRKDDESMLENIESKTLLRACSSQNGDKNNSCAEKYSSPPTTKRKRALKLGCSDREDDCFPANELSCSISEKCTSFSTPKTGKQTLRLPCSDSEDDCFCANDPGGSSRKTSDPQKSKEDVTNVLSSIRKWKSKALKWQFEIDMVSSFETDSILCMKAVCALYRHHIFPDKVMEGSSNSHNSGFYGIYEQRGTALAKFLLEGNHDGDIKKSVKDLEAYDSKGLEDCQRMAKHYSNRLFTMYQKKEDPFFP